MIVRKYLNIALISKMSSPKPTTDMGSPAVTFDHRLGTKGSTTNKRRRRRPSSRNSTHMSSPERNMTKKARRDSTEEDDLETENSTLSCDPKASRLKELLPNMPDPCPALKLVKIVGEGTFSTVYLVKRDKKELGADDDIVKNDPCWRPWYAVKHLIPTSSPERILIEVECLRLSSGRKNVVPLLYCHRILGDVILVMPYIANIKFNDVIKTMDFVEMKAYLKNLLLALSHIHSLGIIHRDIKPANFLYDRKRKKYGLVDFGLAQRGPPPHSNLCNLPSSRLPECKRKLGSSELASEEQGPHTPTISKRTALEDRTQQEVNIWRRTTRQLSNPRTPTSTEPHNPTPYYYDKRGCLLKNGSPARKCINNRNRLKSEEIESLQKPEEQSVGDTNDYQNAMSNVVSTPKKNKDDAEVEQSPTLRRGPRKISSQGNTTQLDAIVPIQHGSFIEAWKLPRRSPRKHQSTLEVLKPPSSLCPGVYPVPPCSKDGTPEMAGPGGIYSTSYSNLATPGSAIAPSGGNALSNIASSCHWDNVPTYLTPNVGRQRNMGLINTSAHGINHGGINRHNSFTILEPASGIPSDESFYSFSKTPRLASLTSRHSFEKVPSHGGSTNMASTLAAFTGGISNTYPSATITSAVQSIRSELPSLAPLPSIPSLNSTTCGNINNALNSQFLSTVKFHAPPSMQPSLANVKRCDCYGMPKICTKCWARRSQKAARAGTPGFRPPEVLLKYEHQTTAVDMWACGVMMLCILSRTYPFFRAPDDVTALAEITTVMGTDAVVQAAEQYGKGFICSEKIAAVDLQDICNKLSARPEADSHGRAIVAPPATLAGSNEAIDLLKQMLQLFQNERITAEQALKHQLFSN